VGHQALPFGVSGFFLAKCGVSPLISADKTTRCLDHKKSLFRIAIQRVSDIDVVRHRNYQRQVWMSTMFSSQDLFSLLRRTNRLQEHLQCIGYGCYERDRAPYRLFDVREVEFIPTQEGSEVVKESRKRRAGSPDDNISVPLFIPDGFCFWTLERLIKRTKSSDANPVFISLENPGCRDERWGDDIPRFRNWWREDESINIFWLSPTQFVSPLWLHSSENFASYSSYSVEFSFNEKYTWSSRHSSLLLYGYHIENITSVGATPEIRLLENNPHSLQATPEAPLQFFKHLVGPVVDKISLIQFSSCQYGLSTSCVSKMLSVIPTNELGHSTPLDRRNDDFRVRFDETFTDEQVDEMASFPFHPNVRLANVRLGFAMVVGKKHIQQYNRLLLQAKHLRRVELPDELLGVDCGEKIFGSDPSFQSVAFSVNQEIPSRQLLQFISECKTIRSLAVHCYSGRHYHTIDSRILDVLRSPCVGRVSSVKEFTIELQVLVSDRRSSMMINAQQFFDQWSRYICSDCNKSLPQHFGLHSFRFAFSDGRYNPFIKSSLQWDSFIVPSLVMNWYHQQPGASPPLALDEIHVMERAVRAVNQGSAFRRATNVVPCDQSPSSASVFFDMLVRNAVSIIKRQALA
jgi:hypothetical protein